MAIEQLQQELIASKREGEGARERAHKVSQVAMAALSISTFCLLPKQCC